MTPSARRRLLGVLATGTVLATALFTLARAADHRDSAALTADPAADIADVFAFVSPTNASNLVLAMTVNGLIPPAEAGATFFDPDVLYQFHIDTDGDAVEERVIQATADGTGSSQTVTFRGPAAPPTTSSPYRLITAGTSAEVQISTGATARTNTGGSLTVFAGVRDDPFFFDLGRFNDIVAGTEMMFRDPGVDAFAGTNVLALVVELPASSLGTGSLGVWATTSRR